MPGQEQPLAIAFLSAVLIKKRGQDSPYNTVRTTQLDPADRNIEVCHFVRVHVHIPQIAHVPHLIGRSAVSFVKGIIVGQRRVATVR